MDSYGKKNGLTNFLFKALITASCHTDPYRLLENMQGLSYNHTWLMPVTLDLLLLNLEARTDLKIKCFGALSSRFECAIYRELCFCVGKLGSAGLLF